MIRIAASVLAVALTGARSPPPTDPLRLIGFGETAQFGTIRVRPLALIADSRCPDKPGVACVWIGEAKIKVAMIDPKGHVRIGQVSTIKPLRIWRGMLNLVTIKPNATTTPIAPGAYRFGFRYDSPQAAAKHPARLAALR